MVVRIKYFFVVGKLNDMLAMFSMSTNIDLVIIMLSPCKFVCANPNYPTLADMYTQVWCSLFTPEAVSVSTKVDPHSPGPYR